MDTLGVKLKRARRQKNKTLKEVAELSGLSISFISNIERGQRNPNLSSLQRICDALGLPMHNLFSVNEGSDDFLVTVDNQPDLYMEDTASEGISYYALTTGNCEITGINMVVTTNNRIDPGFKHEHDEIGVVMQGAIDIYMNDTVYSVHVGDTIKVPRKTVHSLRKISSEPCVSYWFTVSTQDSE